MTQRRAITVPCPQCLARPGRHCRSHSGRTGPAHKARIMSAYHVLAFDVFALDEPQPPTRWRVAHGR